MDTSISVIIPTLGNRNELLYSAVESAARQSIAPLEIIVVNAGGLELKDFRCPPATVIRTPYRYNVSQARNFGSRLAKGDCLAFLDDDDFWDSLFLEEVSNTMSAGSFDVVFGRQIHVSSDAVVVGTKSPTEGSAKDIFLRNPGYGGSNVFIKKDVFTRIGMYRENLSVSQDKALVIDLLLNGFKVGHSSLAVVNCLSHSGPRLTDRESLATGVLEFYEVYSKQMTSYEKAKNLQKLYRLRWSIRPNLLVAILWFYNTCRSQFGRGANSRLRSICFATSKES